MTDQTHTIILQIINRLTSDRYKYRYTLNMDKPITQITNIKSLQQLKEYLQKQSQLNLSVLSDKSNSTLLHFSAYKNDLPKMKLFIKHFKQFTELNHGPSVYTSGGNTFADKLKAWINSPNKQGYVPLLYAGLHGNLQMIQFLQQCGANMHFRTTKNEGILFMCVQNNRIKPLIYLLESKHNYNVNMTNEQGDTILHQACSKGYTQLVGYLLSVGADIQASNNKGETPLIVATREFKKQTVKLLLIKGASREAKNSNGQTALQIAAINQKDDLVKILDNNYGTCDKIKIKCNKKITYEPEKSSYLYSIYFMVLYHLFFLPVNLLSQIKTDERYIQFIPFIFEGIYQLIILTLYFSLLRKPKRKKQVPLMLIQGNFCPECNRGLGNKTFHCFICQRCIYRYDHHCPWINNCVGAHNIGRFTLFLFALLVGLIEVTFCSVCLIIPDNQFIRYRKSIQIPDQVHIPLNVVTILFSSLLAFAILNLLIDQFKNLFTNSTQFERQKKQKGASTIKKPQLLSSEATLNQSFTQDFDEEQRQRPKNFISNCCDMLKQTY